jgi:putative OmpL-like beta-barrel porin-2
MKTRARAAPLLIFSLAALAPASARAGGGPATDAYEGIGELPIEAHVLGDFYVAHDFNDPDSGRVQLRAFDPNANLPSIGWLRLTLARKPRRFGFRVDVGVGDTADTYLADDPAAHDHFQLSRALSYVQQAFVTIVVPVGHGIALDAGKFSTPVGLEDNESWTNWNYSRSLIYTFAEPSLHMGARATYEITDALAVSAYWLNGWNANFQDGSYLRSYALAARWKPVASLELALVYAGGLERPPADLSSPTLSSRNLIDFYAVYHPTRWLGLAVSTDYGNDRASGGVSFWALAGYARAQATRWLAVAVRGEYFDDPNGFATGTVQRIGEFTGTLEVRGTLGRLGLCGRLEYRHDQSTASVFQAGSGFRSVQDMITLGLIASM